MKIIVKIFILKEMPVVLLMIIPKNEIFIEKRFEIDNFLNMSMMYPIGHYNP